MNWKLKATIINTISHFPTSISYASYYWIQRNFGNLKRVNPISGLNYGIKTWKLIKECGYDPIGKVFFEVGTGRVPIAPISYWLMGAKHCITIDLNPYLKIELIRESLKYISDNKEEIHELFGSLMFENRLDSLLSFYRSAPPSLDTFLNFCQIDYIAPGDATKTKLNNQIIDFHTSHSVFEHIPPEVLIQIINEGNRIINDHGLFLHRICYSDHFSHSDNTITPINFLQFSEIEWRKYTGNRYMFMNRLRHDDFINMFQSTGHSILTTKLDIDSQLIEILRKGTIQLNKQFKTKSEEVLSITSAWIVSQKITNQS